MPLSLAKAFQHFRPANFAYDENWLVWDAWVIYIYVYMLCNATSAYKCDIALVALHNEHMSWWRHNLRRLRLAALNLLNHRAQYWTTVHISNHSAHTTFIAQPRPTVQLSHKEQMPARWTMPNKKHRLQGTGDEHPQRCSQRVHRSNWAAFQTVLREPPYVFSAWEVRE